MKINELFKKGKTVFSYEVFPPKKTTPIDTIRSTLDAIKDHSPDFISVTYGAGGNRADMSTLEVALLLKHTYGIEPLFHLTCVSNTREDIDYITEKLKENDIENILALRGDINPDIPPKDDFRHASDLTAYLMKKGGFSVAGACYPECHVESASFLEDIRNLKKKVEAGADHLISQLFFDNSFFYDFLEKARLSDINVPIEAGIMPVVNKSQIERMVTMCGASLPRKFTSMMQRFESHPDALREAGIAYAIDQIIDLISHGVDGIHLYTMNNPYVANRIYESVGPLIKAANQR